MIISIKMKNFYSIEDETVVDFTVGKASPKGNVYKDIGNRDFGKRISLINVFVGSNASGKTNIIKGLAALKHLIADSQSDPDGIGIYYFSPHAMHSGEETVLGAKFSIGKNIFEYTFEFNGRRILYEEMTEWSKSGERFTNKKIFSRKWLEEKKKYDFRLYDDRIDLLLKDLRENASIISVAKQLPRYVFAQYIAEYWNKNVTGNLTFSKSTENNIGMKIPSVDKIIDNKPLKEKVDSLLAGLDLGYKDIRRKEIKIGGTTYYNYLVDHDYNGNTFTTSWRDESSGTRRLVNLLSLVLNSLSVENSTILIDELDADLHPDLSEAVLELFSDMDTNINGTQIIFNTHNHRILETLDKQQIFLTEKDSHGATDIWRLDEMDGVRADDNHYTKYIAGAYAAKPRI